MIYVFDTGSFSKLKHFYPSIFKRVWNALDELVANGKIISTKEVWRELEQGAPVDYVNGWLKDRKQIFTTPTGPEMLLVAQILSIPHFQTLIGEKQRLKGLPVADPFVIACAGVHKGTVVTEEKAKPNSAKIPTVCDHFGIPCINMEAFMHIQGWEF